MVYATGIDAVQVNNVIQSGIQHFVMEPSTNFCTQWSLLHSDHSEQQD